MRVPFLLLSVASFACDTGASAELDRRLAEDRARRARRTVAAAEQADLREHTADEARAVLAEKLAVSRDVVHARWTVDVMAHGFAVGMVDGASGLCAVLYRGDDALAVSSLGRPPALPAGAAALHTGLADPSADQLVQAHEDYTELTQWRQRRCGGASAEKRTEAPDHGRRQPVRGHQPRRGAPGAGHGPKAARRGRPPGTAVR